MSFILKNKFKLLIFFTLIFSFFALRFPSLTLQPIFADEAIYIRWAQVMKSEPTLRFLPLTDGKTPLYMWTLIPLFKIFPDPLFAGRFLSVVAGLFTLLGVFALSCKVFNTQTAFWTAFLYVITPYVVFFDRMALVDSMLAAFTVWIVYFAIWLSQSLRLDIAMFLGYLLGGAVLTKTPGMIHFLILPLSFLAFKIDKSKKLTLLRLVLFWTVAIFIGLVMYNMLRLGPQFQMLSSRNQDYIFSPVELIGRPLDPFLPHFNDISDWFPKLLTWPVLASIFVGIYFIVMKYNKLGLVVLLWALIPLLINMAFLRTFTARYLLSSIPLLLVIAGYGVSQLVNLFKFTKGFSIFLMLVILLPQALYFNFYLLTSPQDAPMPKAERIGYFEDWTAGYGLSEIAQILKQEGKKGKVVVGTEGSFGTLPDGLFIYLDKAGIGVIGGRATISAELREAAKNGSAFFVGNKKGLEGALKSVTLIKEYPKAKSINGQIDSTALYKVLP